MLKIASNIARSPRRAIGLALLAAALLYFLGNAAIPLWDRDEPRYAQTSRQMLQSHNWVVPTFLDQPRSEKPPLIYWCQAAAMSTLGDGARSGVFAARLPSALAMLLTLCLLATVVWNAIGSVRAAWCVFILASSALVILAAKMALTDAMLLLWLMGAQCCLYAIYQGNRSVWITLGLWLAIALGALTKGPIVLVPPIFTMGVLAVIDGLRLRRIASTLRWWLGTRPWAGVLIIAAVAGPWLYLVEQRSPGFLQKIWAAGSRHMGTGEKHVAPPGYYLLLIWGFFFPWSLLLPTALTLAWKNRHLPPVRFALAAAIGPWIFQEIMPNKGPFYILPALPPLAFLTADALVRCLRGSADDLRRPAFKMALGVWCIAAIALACAPWLLVFPGKIEPQPYAILCLLTLIGVGYAATVWLQFRAHLCRAAIAMGLGFMLLMGVLLAGYLPSAEFLQLPLRAGRALQQAGATQSGQVQMVQYKEPSLAYYQGGTIREQPLENLLNETPSEQWPRWIIMPLGLWQTVKPEIQQRLEVINPAPGAPPLRGLDVAGKIGPSRWVELVILRKR